MAQTHIGAAKSPEDVYRKDIEKFVSLYKEHNLFDQIPARQHDGFPNYRHSERITNPAKLKAKLLAHSLKLDKGRNLLPD